MSSESISDAPQQAQPVSSEGPVAQNPKKEQRNTKTDGKKSSRSKKSNGDSKKPGKKTKPSKKDLENDPTTASKFLQISKLVKKYKPVTINGVSTKSIIEQIKQKEVGDADYFKSRYTNSDRLSHIQKHLLEFIKNQPDSIIYLSFIIRPSDPEFPFDLKDLKINMSIPANYPRVKAQRPSIVVLNDEIPRGFAINVELGYKRIVDIAINKVTDEEIQLVEGSGLKSQIMTLDKYLELFLKQEKRETIKFVKTKKKESSPKTQEKSASPDVQPSEPVDKLSVDSKIDPKILKERNSNVEEMNNKLGSRVKLFKKSAQENRYKVTLPVLDKSDDSLIPQLWKLNNSVDIMLSVPGDYPQTPLSISVPNNFDTNLILKYKNAVLESNDQLSLVSLAHEYRQIEKNLVQNIKSYTFASTNLIFILNWLTNHLGKYCLSQQKFSDWTNATKMLQEGISSR